MKRFLSKFYTASATPSLFELVARWAVALVFPVLLLQFMGWGFNAHNSFAFAIAGIAFVFGVWIEMVLIFTAYDAINNKLKVEN